MASIIHSTQGETGNRFWLHRRHFHWEMPSAANRVKGALEAGPTPAKRPGLRHALAFSAAGMVRNPQALASEASIAEQEVS
jgi:hypothetical protein